jgi:hypothetical protein
MKLHKGRALTALALMTVVVVGGSLLMRWWLVPSVLTLDQLTWAFVGFAVVDAGMIAWYGSDLRPRWFWHRLSAWIRVEDERQVIPSPGPGPH